jgi:hypothetical protein
VLGSAFAAGHVLGIGFEHTPSLREEELSGSGRGE